MLYWKPFIFNIFVLCVAIKYTILSTAVWHKYSVAVRPSDPATPKYGAGPADVSGHLDQDQGAGHSTSSTQPSKPVSPRSRPFSQTRFSRHRLLTSTYVLPDSSHPHPSFFVTFCAPQFCSSFVCIAIYSSSQHPVLRFNSAPATTVL